VAAQVQIVNNPRLLCLGIELGAPFSLDGGPTAQ
jgi:hypothetical protein